MVISFLQFKMVPSSLKVQLSYGNKISTIRRKSTAMRYVSLLRKTGKLSINHSSDCPRKLTPKNELKAKLTLN